MLEVLKESLWTANLPFTLLLLGVMGYWLLMILGAVDFDGFDVDLDADAHTGGSTGVVFGLSQLLGARRTPFMVVFSVFALSMWLLSMIGNHYFNDSSLLRALLLLVPNLLLSVLVTRTLMLPLSRFFGTLNKDGEKHRNLLGKTCVIATLEATPTFGQGEVVTGGAPLRLNVRTSEGVTLRKGDRALIVKEDPDRQFYYVIKVTTDKLEE